MILFLGVRSVFSGVVGGAAGTVSRITGALGKGIASLTFDEKFLKKRREAIKKRGNQNFRESLARSSKGLAMGIVEGVTGVATKPYQGARDDGVGGFFKGVGKGDLKSFLVFIFLKACEKEWRFYRSILFGTLSISSNSKNCIFFFFNFGPLFELL